MSIPSITGKTNNIPTPSKPTQSVKSNSNGEQVNDKKVESASLDVSLVTNKIAQALEASSSSEIINRDRVNAVKNALEKGTYPIDAEQIAKKMMEMEKDFQQFRTGK